MPVVGAPLGSTLARENSTRASAVSGRNGAGVLLTSGFVRRKSRLSTSIWLAICASEMFCAAVFQTTCTTTGMRVTPGRSAAPPCRHRAAPDSRFHPGRARRRDPADSSRRCTSIVPHVRERGCSGALVIVAAGAGAHSPPPGMLSPRPD